MCPLQQGSLCPFAESACPRPGGVLSAGEARRNLRLSQYVRGTGIVRQGEDVTTTTATGRSKGHADLAIFPLHTFIPIALIQSYCIINFIPLSL